MSHIVTGKSQMTDPDKIRDACEAEEAQFLGEGNHQLYNGQRSKGIGVKLKGWRYPMVINPDTGELKYDNYGGSWGKADKLRNFKQAYTETGIQKITKRRVNRVVSRERLKDGKLKLRIQVR